MVRWTCLGKRYIALEYKMVWYAVYFRIFFPERNDCKRILNLNIAPQGNFVITRNTFPDWLLLCTCLRNEKQEKGYLNVPNHYKTKEFLALHKKWRIWGLQVIPCLLHKVLYFKSKYRAQTISLIWIPFLSLRISLRLFLQFYRWRWERSIGLCHRVKNKISQKDTKCVPSCVTVGILFCAGESFGVLRQGTSPQISFSNDILIKILGDHLIFRRTKGGSMKTLEGFRGGAMSQFVIIIALCNTCRNL